MSNSSDGPMKKRRTRAIAMLPGMACFPAAILAARPQGDASPEFHSSEFPGMDYVLHRETYRQVDDAVRQIDFTLTISDDPPDHDDHRADTSSEVDGPITMDGTAQVQCRTRQVRILDSRLRDKDGKSLGKTGAGTTMSWTNLQPHGPDQHLYDQMCQQG